MTIEAHFTKTRWGWRVAVDYPDDGMMLGPGAFAFTLDGAHRKSDDPREGSLGLGLRGSVRRAGSSDQNAAGRVVVGPGAMTDQQLRAAVNEAITAVDHAVNLCYAEHYDGVEATTRLAPRRIRMPLRRARNILFQVLRRIAA
jgi:hypothetical protein